MGDNPKLDLEFLVTELALEQEYITISRCASDGSGEPCFKIESVDFTDCGEAVWGSFSTVGNSILAALQEYYDRFLKWQKEQADNDED